MPGSYEVNVELPGIEANGVSVEIHGNALTVKGTKSAGKMQEAREYYFSERRLGIFECTFQLPPDANQDEIKADFNNGVLTIVIATMQVPFARRQRLIL